MNPRQLVTIARFEVLMAYRRRTPVILLALYISGVIAFAFFSKDIGDAFASPVRGGMPQGVTVRTEVWLGSSMVSNSMIGTLILGSVAIVLLFNETIPLDRHYRVRELLDALPLSRTTYLAGKLLSVWGSILAVTLITAIVSLITFPLMLGEFDLLFWFVMWSIFALPVGLIASTGAILLTSWARTRRAAIYNSLLILPLVILVYVTTLTLVGGENVFLQPSNGLLLLLYGDTEQILSQRVPGKLPLIIIVPLLSWFVAWAWQRLREAR